MNGCKRDMFVIFRNLYFYVPSWNIFGIFFCLNFSHLPFYVNVFNMCSESHEFTFLHFLKIYGLLKSWISYLLYSISSSHMYIYNHHGSLNPKLVLSLSIHFSILMNIVFKQAIGARRGMWSLQICLGPSIIVDLNPRR